MTHGIKIAIQLKIELGRNGFSASLDLDINFLYPAGARYRIICQGIQPKLDNIQDLDSALLREKNLPILRLGQEAHCVLHHQDRNP